MNENSLISSGSSNDLLSGLDEISFGAVHSCAITSVILPLKYAVSFSNEYTYFTSSDPHGYGDFKVV